MIINEKCQTCAHSRVCSIKRELAEVKDDIKERARSDSNIISISINCSEYEERRITIR